MKTTKKLSLFFMFMLVLFTTFSLSTITNVNAEEENICDWNGYYVCSI